MFGTNHLIWLALSATFIIGMGIISIRRNFSLKKAGYIMTTICILSEGSKIRSGMLASPEGGMHLDPHYLPFHLCSLLLFGVLYITFGENAKVKKVLIDFLAVMGTLGGIAALLIPTNGTDFLDPEAYQCFVYHAGLIWFAIYLIASGKAEISFRSWKRNIIFLLCLAVLMIYINSALSVYDTNFFYITRPPMENLPFLNLNHGWYVYFAHIASLGIAMISLFHLTAYRLLKKCR